MCGLLEAPRTPTDSTRGSLELIIIPPASYRVITHKTVLIVIGTVAPGKGSLATSASQSASTAVAAFTDISLNGVFLNEPMSCFLETPRAAAPLIGRSLAPLSNGFVAFCAALVIIHLMAPGEMSAEPTLQGSTETATALVDVAPRVVLLDEFMRHPLEAPTAPSGLDLHGHGYPLST